MSFKNEVLRRSFIVLAGIVAIGASIFFKAVQISQVQGAKWRSMGDSLYVKLVAVEADRGNILSDEGSILATSMSVYDVRFDLMAEGISDKVFLDNVDTLSYCLSKNLMAQYTPKEIKNILIEKRQLKERYFLLKSEVSRSEVERVRLYPLFNLGRNKGGLILVKKSKRNRPFNMLARRTIGYIRENAQPIGLEGFYNGVLSGNAGKQLMQRVSGDTWLPVNDMTSIEPKSGKDIQTTININMQEIAHEALLQSLKTHDAEYGCAVVMEVKTGAIKAMVNLGKEDGEYLESYNYAIGAATEPGSTFKTATMMAMMEDDYLNLNDTVNIQAGKINYCGVSMEDAEKHNYFNVSVKKAFANSSNVGISKLATSYYGRDKKAKSLISRYKQFHLDAPTGILMEGEAKPYIKNAFDTTQSWSCVSLPWISIGYESKLTPLQVLNFYNTIANDGKMMQPYLVTAIKEFETVVESFEPKVIDSKIASAKTITKIKEMLEEVIETGTMKDYHSQYYSYAGKTGTTQLNYSRDANAKTDVGGYQASFVGYFPADKPVYSCIVLVNKPKQNGYYGATVAGKVFKNIADKYYASQKGLQEVVIAPKKSDNIKLPSNNVGNAKDMSILLSYMNMAHKKKQMPEWTNIQSTADSVKLFARAVNNDMVPNVVGMGLKDALYLLENKGLKVEVWGVGKVVNQSVPHGTKARGQYITIQLN